MNSLENYFQNFRRNIIGQNYVHEFHDYQRTILYADWAAGGRLYKPIEDYITDTLGPYIANTHTETNLTGTVMTDVYRQAHDIIKHHVNASKDDVLLFAGFGMTAAINKFQRILGLRVPEIYKPELSRTSTDRPLVIITHMEHHSNQTTWEECLCDVLIIKRGKDGTPDLDHLHYLLNQNKTRKFIIGSFTACSNVTGIITPVHTMAEMIHNYGGYCFIDYSAYAPYGAINMHPENETQKLDAVLFSPHKFLGGPGSSGVIVFNKKLYRNPVPDHPGGGTVKWTNPWGEHRFIEDIETREDGGTPGFLQAIKASLAVLLKEKMGIEKIEKRESELKEMMFSELEKIPAIHILESNQKNRIGFISFYSSEIHHNLLVKLLSDKFGIQVRGGCTCAGTYGHILLHINKNKSRQITRKIDNGDLSIKPGWVRVSLHPTMTNLEIKYIIEAIKQVIHNHQTWGADYEFNPQNGEYQSREKSEYYIDIKKTFMYDI